MARTVFLHREAVMQRSAVFSPDRRFRYSLHRKWADTERLNVIMLNPSTADETIDDPTIRRVIGFAAREGFGDLVITNLFAYRATDPKDLRAFPLPIGIDNEDTVINQAQSATQVWVAWGAHGTFMAQGTYYAWLLRSKGVELRCFGLTKEGEPRHPLYLHGETPLVVWP